MIVYVRVLSYALARGSANFRTDGAVCISRLAGTKLEHSSAGLLSQIVALVTSKDLPYLRRGTQHVATPPRGQITI
jgi:hypothetical protein